MKKDKAKKLACAFKVAPNCLTDDGEPPKNEGCMAWQALKGRQDGFCQRLEPYRVPLISPLEDNE